MDMVKVIVYFSVFLTGVCFNYCCMTLYCIGDRVKRIEREAQKNKNKTNFGRVVNPQRKYLLRE